MNDSPSIPNIPPGENERPHKGFGTSGTQLPRLIQEPLEIIGEQLELNEALPGLALHEPTAILLDVNNLYRRADENGFRIDYLKLRAMFSQRCDLRYAGVCSAVDRTDPKAQQWVSYMRRHGYDTITRDLKRYINRDGDAVSKGNMDVELTIAAMSLSPGFTHVVIGTCDGDFVPLVEKLREGHLRKVSVLGITNDDNSGMSDALRNAADNFYDMTAIRGYIEYLGGANIPQRRSHGQNY